jgi:hypothetical protein
MMVLCAVPLLSLRMTPPICRAGIPRAAITPQDYFGTTIGTVPKINVDEAAEAVRECLAEAETTVEQQDCKSLAEASTIVGASTTTLLPPPLARAAFIVADQIELSAGLFAQFTRAVAVGPLVSGPLAARVERKQESKHDDPPRPWIIATAVATMAMRRVFR